MEEDKIYPFLRERNVPEEHLSQMKDEKVSIKNTIKKQGYIQKFKCRQFK